VYRVVSKIIRTGAAIYTAIVVARSTGPNSLNCEFRVLLRRFAVTAWKRAKTSPRTLARTDLAASVWQRSVPHFHPHPTVSGETQNGFHPHPPCSSDLAPCDFYLYPKMKLVLKRRRFDTIEEIQAELQRVLDTDRKWFPGSVPKMEETVGPVSTCGRELLRGWWRPIGLGVSFMILQRPSGIFWIHPRTTYFSTCVSRHSPQ
jgi:hypothetical protein